MTSYATKFWNIAQTDTNQNCLKYHGPSSSVWLHFMSECTDIFKTKRTLSFWPNWFVSISYNVSYYQYVIEKIPTPSFIKSSKYHVIEWCTFPEKKYSFQMLVMLVIPLYVAYENFKYIQSSLKRFDYLWREIIWR